MHNLFHHEPPELTQKDILWPLYCAKPTVKILFYTDRPDVVLNKTNSFGVGLLQEWIQTNNPFYVNFQIDLLNRHDGGHASNKLTSTLLKKYDQVWFFGINQCNLPLASENELTNSEVAALQSWMKTGGVLMTGDHANPKPSNAAASLGSLLNLGRALGHRVPRAGQLRKWEGYPSSDTGTLPLADPMGPRQNHNTQTPTATYPLSVIDGLAAQSDNEPQQLILKTYPLSLHRSRPHPLFCGRQGAIYVFPDHMHEGMLVTPPALTAPEWPTGSSAPEVIASGTDKRTGKVWPVVSAWDGDRVNVGRIVADSTWHHYFNINLWGWTSGFPAYTADSSATQKAIADYFVNLAVWLSPKNKRSAMRCRILWTLANHPLVQEVMLSHQTILGATAYDVLGSAASQCTIYHFVFHDFPPDWLLDVDLERPPRPWPWPWPPEELILGGILREYQEAMSGALKKIPDRMSLIENGFRRTLDYQVETLGEQLKQTKKLRADVEELFGRKTKG